MSASLRRLVQVAWLLVALAFACNAIAQAPATTLPDTEWVAIKRVIETQLEALRRGDGQRAFTFATRGLRDQFGNAEAFMRMVRNGYQPLIDARYSQFLDGAVIDGRTIQPLRLVMHDNTVLVALYTMEKEDDGRWRIAGCMLAPSTVRAA